ncbi:hypothetical protein J6590_011398 [Homalodisca vitripennis]|nr:hypothetical protein J6590_011398 [Homalodisca vitripennis]
MTNTLMKLCRSNGHAFSNAQSKPHILPVTARRRDAPALLAPLAGLVPLITRLSQICPCTGRAATLVTNRISRRFVSDKPCWGGGCYNVLIENSACQL